MELTVPLQHRVACDLRGRCLPHRQVHASRAKENRLPNSDRRETELNRPPNFSTGADFIPSNHRVREVWPKKTVLSAGPFVRQAARNGSTQRLHSAAHFDSCCFPVRSNRSSLKSRKPTKTPLHHSSTGLTSISLTSMRITLDSHSIPHPPSSHPFSIKTVCRRLITKRTSFLSKYSPRSCSSREYEGRRGFWSRHQPPERN